MDHSVHLTFRMLYEGEASRMNGGRSIGDPIEHDFHPALVRMSAQEFTDVARRVFDGSRKFDDIVVASGVPDAYLVGSECSSYEAWVEPRQFEEYLRTVGLSPALALTMTEQDMSELRARVVTLPSPSRP